MPEQEASTHAAAGKGGTERPSPPAPAMLNPPSAWRFLCARTGGSIALVTFYRWVRSGKVYSIRLGQRIFIPQVALEEVIRQCLSGDRF